MQKIIAAFAFATLATIASAHSSVDTTTPANEEVLSAVPAQITFDFASEIRMTRVNLTHDGVTEVQLDLGDQKTFRTDFILPLPDAGSGEYLIEWRALGKDGHALQGSFSFTVE
jgi:methionine-rich copper-binding protein CopC